MVTSTLLSPMNPAEIHRMSLDELLTAFQSGTSLLVEEEQKAALSWPELMRIGYYACSVSQRLHLLICQQRRRSEMPCELAAPMFERFVTTAKRILRRETLPADINDFQVYTQHIEDRQSDLAELSKSTTDRDQSLGFEVRERPRGRS